MDHLKLTVDKLNVETVNELVLDDSCGAVSMFVGTTRDNFEGKKVLRLEYEAYEPMAIKAMKSICDDVRDKWPSVHHIAMYHRLGMVPTREASVIIAVSSPHRQDSLSAVAHCIDALKGSVPIWKKEVYDSADPVWKENVECSTKESIIKESRKVATTDPAEVIDKSLVQINVSSEELQQRIQNFIERKREQVNVSNIHDFIPGGADDEEETCARVRTVFVKRTDSKGHLKIRKVHNEWGPQLSRSQTKPETTDNSGLPVGIAERVLTIEKYLNMAPVERDVYRRLREMEDRIAVMQAMSPEYAQFWRQGAQRTEESVDRGIAYTFTADDITKKIEQLEKEGMA